MAYKSYFFKIIINISPFFVVDVFFISLALLNFKLCFFLLWWKLKKLRVIFSLGWVFERNEIYALQEMSNSDALYSELQLSWMNSPTLLSDTVYFIFLLYLASLHRHLILNYVFTPWKIRHQHPFSLGTIVREKGCVTSKGINLPIFWLMLCYLHNEQWSYMKSSPNIRLTFLNLEKKKKN